MASRNPSLSHEATANGLARSNSDPNLARDDQDDEGAVIPDYNAPPPYAINTSQPQPQSNVSTMSFFTTRFSGSNEKMSTILGSFK